tara:strand:- start:340 stop:507 length:168 start_codon:yes stop_codon:yes gene_type:complete
MPNLETLLNDMGVSIKVVCNNYGIHMGAYEIHELTTACKPEKVISVSVEIKERES